MKKVHAFAWDRAFPHLLTQGVTYEPQQQLIEWTMTLESTLLTSVGMQNFSKFPVRTIPSQKQSKYNSKFKLKCNTKE